MSIGFVVAWRGTGEKDHWKLNPTVYPAVDLANSEMVLEKFKHPNLAYCVVELNEAAA